MASATTPGSSTILTKFLIISDTHNLELEDSTNDHVPLRSPLPKVDVVLHCGDLTHCGGLSSYRKALNLLGAFDAELKLFIAGNHDLDLDKECWNSHLEEDDEPEDHLKAIEVVKGELAAKAGATFLEEGTYSFTLKSGAVFIIHTSPYTPAFCDWAFAYDHCDDRFNKAYQVADGVTSIATHPIPSFPLVDIVMTHGPPKGVLDRCAQGIVGCENLLHALQRARPRMHCFGHIHEGNGTIIMDWESAETEMVHPTSSHSSQYSNPYPEAIKYTGLHGQQSLLVNAAIMDETNRPVNAPWLVELDLPRIITR